MSRWNSKIAIALGLVGLLALAGVSNAGEMIKEHDCVGNDLKFTDYRAGDAGCTPLGSPITPGYGDNFYGTEDTDDFAREGFTAEGAYELLNPDSSSPNSPTGIWETVPTVKTFDHLQVGQRARFTYNIGIKGQSVLSDIEVTCSVCAQRPQRKGPGATFVESTAPPDHYNFDGESRFFDYLNALQTEWTMSVQHFCGTNRLDCGAGQQLEKPLFVLIPGLDLATQDPQTEKVTFIGCKATSIFLDNEGQYREGDIIRTIINVPATAKSSARMDVTSCEIAYLRTCNAGEGYFKDICAQP
jgi:hypothetical protein